MPASLNSAAKLREALQLLAADAMTDEGENVLATEVLWTPQVGREARTNACVCVWVDFCGGCFFSPVCPCPLHSCALALTHVCIDII